MEWPRLAKNIFLAVVYLLALSVTVAYLFFPSQFSQVRVAVSDLLGVHNASVQPQSGKELRIGLVNYPDTLEPTKLDRPTRTLALQVYEPLVRTDRFLKIESALTLSWGRVSLTKWRFELRPNVTFHDGTVLTVDDVIASFNRAANYKNSDLKALVKGLTLEAGPGNVFYILTEKPDPLLLQKISTVLIIPQEYETKSTFSPSGTGPYKFMATKPNISFIFQAIPSYWGDTPAFKNVVFSFYPRREDREKALLQGDVDVAIDVPPESIKRLEGQSLKIDVLPSLEVNFLSFNVQGVFKNPSLRRAVSLGIDKNTFVDLSLGYATDVNQYVSSGVFGFNPAIEPSPYDPEKATDLVKRVSSFDLIPITVKFVEGLETAGDYIAKQLQTIGFDPKVQYVSWEDFRDSLSANNSDMYFFGWKSDLGSAADFYLNAVHTRDEKNDLGLYNAGGFSNPDVDQMIEDAVTQFDAKKRIKAYQTIMKIIVNQFYGIPLFESETLYASSLSVHFQPRIDGYILASDIY